MFRSPSLRRRARSAIAVLAAAGLAATTTTALALPPSAAAAASTLGAAAAQTGRYFGAAISASHLGESAYVNTWSTEFNSVTPENEMKWDTVEPSPNRFNFGPADQIVSQARSRNMSVRGHTFVWYQQIPDWVKNLNGNDLRAAIANHINQVAGHWKGQIYAWDVVNEAFEENGSRRQWFVQQRLGDGFMDEAFRTARAADPNAKLCYNDYNTDGINAKSTGIYNMVRDFKSRGVPIDCVGFQSHLSSGANLSSYQANLQRFADLGVDVQITELDVGGSGSGQAATYRTVIQACMAVTRCTGITPWGVTDKYSWRSDTPLLFDGNYSKKQAYTAVLDALNGGGGGGGNGTLRSVSANKCVDVPNSSTTAGTQLQIWDCHSGSNQQWTRSASGEISVYTGDSKRCLDTSGTGAGASTVIANCNGGNNQKWNANSNGTVTNVQSGLCLDVNGRATANGTKVIIWSCNGGTNQQWTGLSDPGPGPGPGPLPSRYSWSSSQQLISPKSDSSHTIAGIKDPSVVYHDGKWHVFASVANAAGYNMVYLSFTDWAQASAAPHFYLDRSGIGAGYRAAPEVFYFAPQNLWYLVYQDGNAAYSTNPDIGNPAGWTAPKHFYQDMPKIIRDNIGNGYWVDMWVICDTTDCHLFSSDDNGHLYRSQAPIGSFPNGMSEPVIAAQDSDRYKLFEASNVYKVDGSNQYLLIIEAIGAQGRYFRSWTSGSIAGPWTALADTESAPLAGAANVTFPGSGWTRDISHGEMIRSGRDQTLSISPCGMRYLYQGRDPNSGGDYNSLPWRLGLLTQTNSPC